jgi:uncharacterized membrane protein (DUF373 family)
VFVDDRGRDLARVMDRGLVYAETAIYAVVAIALVAGAVALVAQSAYEFVDGLHDGVVTAATALVSTLLLVFIFVELLGAVRVTIRERQLLAEPFLLVGIIASIKEIVVVAGAKETPHDFAEFRDTMIEIGVLAGVALVLSVSALLLRRRQREPSEAEG